MSRRYLEGVLRGGGETPIGGILHQSPDWPAVHWAAARLARPKRFGGVNEMSNTLHSSYLLGGGML